VAAGSAAAATTGAKPAGAAFKLGYICSCSGPQAAIVGDAQKVATAWVNHVNGSGGINGHPVDLVIKDDGSNPATALEDVKAIVEQSHVVGIVDSSLVDDAFAKYLTSKGVPVVGGASENPVMSQNPDFFPSGSTLLPYEIGTIAPAQGHRNLGVMYCAESPICAQLIKLASGIGAAFKVKVTPQKIAVTSPNYTAPCLAMKSAGVDVLLVLENGATVQRVISDCSQQGYTPTEISQAPIATNPLLGDPHLNGTLMASTNANAYDASLPATQQFQQAVDKVYPGLIKSPSFASAAFYAWIGGQLFAAAAKAGHLTPNSTPADLKNALYSLKNETLGGLAPPLTYTRGKPYSTNCWFTSTVHGGTLVSTHGNKPVCIPAAQMAAIAQALHLG
jgi:branched-chain amino acid transport system substrate-binding protein